MGVLVTRICRYPHPEVQNYYENRAIETDEWLRGMRKLQGRLDEAKNRP